MKNYERIDLESGHIKKMTWDNPVKSKSELKSLLEGWLILSQADVIGSPSLPNNTPVILIQLGEDKYYINGDTRREGVTKAVSHIQETWKVVENNRGVKNKIVFSTFLRTMESIRYFYFYKKL